MSLYDITNKILSRNSDYIIEVVMWPNFGNSSISMREVIETSIYKDLTRKTNFLRGAFGWSSIMALKFYTSVEKRLKLKFKRF